MQKHILNNFIPLLRLSAFLLTLLLAANIAQARNIGNTNIIDSNLPQRIKPIAPAPQRLEVKLTANPASVPHNTTTQLSWDSSSATQCTTSWGDKGTSGTFTTPRLTKNTTYRVTCRGRGTVKTAEVTVNVVTAAPAPQLTINLSASPTNVDYRGQSTLSWSSSNAITCQGTWGPVGLNGTFTTPELTTNTTYTLTCVGTGTARTASVTIQVAPPTPAPQVSVSANPSTVEFNGSSTIQWSSSNATSCSTPWNSIATQGSHQTGSLTATTTYTVTCSGPGGNASASTTVTVNPEPDPDPDPEPPPVSVTLTADPMSVEYGGTTRLTWRTQNVTFCEANFGSVDEPNGSIDTPPLTQTTTFNIYCGTHNQQSTKTTSLLTNTNDPNQPNFQHASVTVIVGAPPPPPPPPPAPELRAAFSASPTSGPAPLNVTFTDQSSGTITAWHWDFGDGSVSTLQHPMHRYATPGTYRVSLQVTGPDGQDTETKNSFIVAFDGELSTVQLSSRNLNMHAVLQFDDFHGQGRYTRFIRNIVLSNTEIINRIKFVVAGYGVSNPYFAASTYEMLCYLNGEGSPTVVSTKTVAPNVGVSWFENIDLRSIPDGWHLFDIRPTTPTAETAVPFWMYVGDPAASATSPWVPIQYGSYTMTHEDYGVMRWGKAPAAINPPAFVLPPRTAEHFSTPITPAQLFRRNLSPTTNGDLPYIRTIENGLRTGLNTHGYAFSTLTAELPRTVLRDGPYGVGLLSGPTHLAVGRRGDVYFSDSWSVGKISPTGTIQRLAGYRHTDSGLELIGNWSSVPEERRGFRLLWGFAWRSLTVAEATLDRSRIIDRGDGVEENPHTMQPTLFVADSLRHRVARIRFAPDRHNAEPVIDEFITYPGEANPWDVVEADDVLYVSERRLHRIAAYNAATGAFIRTVVQGPANANAMAQVDRHDKPSLINGVTLATAREQTVLLPEGLFLQDGWLYFGSIVMGQVKRINLETDEIQVWAQWNPVSKSEYVKFALSDGTFGPRGSTFISTWEVDKQGAPWAFLPPTAEQIAAKTGGTGWGIITMGSRRLQHGKGGRWAGIGYSTACAVKDGRLVYGGADYGLVEFTKAAADDPQYDEDKYSIGMAQYNQGGYRLTNGLEGFGQWQDAPLPWGISEELDYFLTVNGHE